MGPIQPASTFLSPPPPLTDTPTPRRLYVSPSVSLPCPAVSPVRPPPPAAATFVILLSALPPPLLFFSSIYHIPAHLFPKLGCPFSPFPPFHPSPASATRPQRPYAVQSRCATRSAASLATSPLYTFMLSRGCLFSKNCTHTRRM